MKHTNRFCVHPFYWHLYGIFVENSYKYRPLGSMNIFKVIDRKGRVILQVVRRWHLTAMAWVRTQFSRFVKEKLALSQVYLWVLRYFPINIIPSLLHMHSYIIWGWTNSPLETRSRGHTVSHRRNNTVQLGWSKNYIRHFGLRTVKATGCKERTAL